MASKEDIKNKLATVLAGGATLKCILRREGLTETRYILSAPNFIQKSNSTRTIIPMVISVVTCFILKLKRRAKWITESNHLSRVNSFRPGVAKFFCR